MVRVLLDACVPHRLRKELTEFDVETAHYAALDHLFNGALLAAIEGRFDVLVTLDRNLTYQQKIAGRSMVVIVIRVREQTPAAFKTLLPELKIAIGTAAPGIVSVIGEDIS
jgi:predicted nuclease of predicted toxin-antitoxin system